jgi:hypothetical protein
LGPCEPCEPCGPCGPGLEYCLISLITSVFVSDDDFFDLAAAADGIAETMASDPTIAIAVVTRRYALPDM